MNWEYVKKEDKRVEFPVSLEYLAKEIGIPDDWTNTAKRRQVIKTLKKLDTKEKDRGQVCTLNLRSKL